MFGAVLVNSTGSADEAVGREGKKIKKKIINIKRIINYYFNYVIRPNPMKIYY